MAYKLIVLPAARADVIESAEWYNSASAGLGSSFYKNVQTTIKQIKNNPFSSATRYANYRSALMNKFPYMVHYFIDNELDRIVVFAILHTSRNPEIWQKRMPDTRDS